MSKLLETVGEVDYNYFTDTYTYNIIDIVQTMHTDDHGTYASDDFVQRESIEMDNETLKRDYKNQVSLANHNACMKEIEEVYNVTRWL